METQYKSKLGKGILSFVLTILVLTAAVHLYLKSWIGVAIGIWILAFYFLLYLKTIYIIRYDNLVIHNGFLYKIEIQIKSIESISEVTNYTSSPAFSTDRLKITYNSKKTIYISPKEKEQFIAEILEKNPSIEMKYRA